MTAAECLREIAQADDSRFTGVFDRDTVLMLLDIADAALAVDTAIHTNRWKQLRILLPTARLHVAVAPLRERT